jgi:hypothetical protein
MLHRRALEAEPPLIVNADAMLTASIAMQSFEAAHGTGRASEAMIARP